jgi:hypothetical protein
MPDEVLTEAVDVIRRRIVWVHRRHGLRETGRVACLLIAIVAGAAASGLMLALVLGARAFVVAAWGLAAVVPLIGLAVGITGWQRRLRHDRAAAWIDGQAALGGRLLTLVEVARRGPRDAFFLPLLVEQNRDRLPSWPPERLVPRIVPRGELAAAVAGLAALGLVVGLAPGWRPHASGRTTARLDAGEVGSTADGDATQARAVATPVEDPTGLAGLPLTLRDRLRDAVWGTDWAELPPAATARAERPADTGRVPHRRSDDDTRLASLPSDDRAGEAEEPNASDTERTDASEHGTADTDESAPGPGAGTGTDPNLLGTATERTDGHTTFELALGARVRARRERPNRSPDEAPPAEPDARPALAGSERRAAAVHHMPVPPAYEAIVRAAFAHRAAGEHLP